MYFFKEISFHLEISYVIINNYTSWYLYWSSLSATTVAFNWCFMNVFRKWSEEASIFSKLQQCFPSNFLFVALKLESSQQIFILMKTSWRRLLSSSSEAVLIKTNMFTLALRLQKTSSRRLQDQYISLGHMSSRRLQDVFKIS